MKNFLQRKCKLNKKGISQLVENMGILAIVVAAIIVVMAIAPNAVASIWTTVTNNAKNFFNSSTTGFITIAIG